MMGKFSKTDIWFAWYPVTTGPLHEGDRVWLRKVWRNRTYFTGMWVTIYQKLPTEYYDVGGNYNGP